MMEHADGIEVRFERSGLRKGRVALEKFTRTVLEQALLASGFPGSGVSVLYCGDADIQKLNRDFRSIDKPTDVLSFPSGEAPDEAGFFLGDLAISLRYTATHPVLKGKPLEDQVRLLLLHGLLHLLGYDHDTKDAEAEMWEETDRLLESTESIPRPKLELA